MNKIFKNNAILAKVTVQLRTKHLSTISNKSLLDQALGCHMRMILETIYFSQAQIDRVCVLEHNTGYKNLTLCSK